MHKEPSWRAKAMYIVFAFALVFGLAGVVAMPAQPAAEASPDATFRLSAAAAAGTACWVPKATFTPYAGDWSVKLDHLAAAGSVYLEFVPEPGITLSDLAALTNEWSFWYHLDTSSWGPYLELKFTSCGADFIDITIMRQTSDLIYNAWTEVVLTTSIGGVQYWGNVRGNVVTYSGSTTLQAALIALENVSADWSAADWELTRVQVQLWENVDRTCYVDDITIDGTLYPVERGPEFWLDPDIAYNVKTATETFTAMGPCGPLVGDTTELPANDPYVVSWSVLKGCGVPGGGDVETIAGTGEAADATYAGDKYITIRLVTKGDAHVCAVIDTDGTNGSDPTIEVCAEKKWGEIYCTQLTKGDLVAHESCVTEYVQASFLWYDCSVEIQLPVDDAVVDWWLMGIGALAAVQALEVELGVDPCDVNGGCGTYQPDFFSYDVDGDGTIQADEVFDSPRLAMLAIYAQYELTPLQKNTNYLMPDVTLPADKAHTTTASDVNGLTTVTVHTESLTSVMLATLTDYPIDKHGQNAVCVQHETWVAPPPEVQVKIPQVAWAGEKIVLEKHWGDTFYGKVVTFQVDQGSIGTLSPIDGTGYGQEVATTVQSDGVARAILESEYEGQAEVKCILYDAEGAVLDNHDFPVFFIKLESVEAIGTYPTVEVGVDVDFGLQVKGWFITGTTELAVDPDTGLVRAEKPVDVDGDGTIDQILPRGRWVLPDDWSRLAGIFETRRHWDLMDNATDAIDSTNALGPFNTAVVTTNPPNVAQKNVVGPFSTTQPVALEGGVIKWIATATVVGDATLLLPAALRNTVVPNGILEWQDCPMPAAYLMFTVSGTTLSEALKTGVAGYFTGSNFIWPFYSYEIPSSRFIPIGGVPEGYRWDSWGWLAAAAGGPYDFWKDLGVSALTTKLEVYTDNNGRAYVTLNARTILGTAIISAIADYPYQRKHPAMKSADETIYWGAEELNPHFVADKTDVDAEEVVTFDNLTGGGTAPYTKAEWDFDADGTIDLTKTGTHAQVMVDVTHFYSTAGVYTVRLWMTDSTPTTRYEERPDYITVAGAVPTVTLTMQVGIAQDPASYNLVYYSGDTVSLPTGSEPPCLEAVYYYDAVTMTLLYYIPGFLSNMTQLMADTPYIIIVDDATVADPCEWVITQP